MPRLARILIYPVKSFDAVAVEKARVLDSGALEHDRRFAVVDRTGKSVNGKRTPLIHQLRSAIDPVARRIRLSVRGDSREFDLDVDRVPLEKWLTEFFGQPVRVIENPAAGFPDDTEASGPTLISTATLEEVAGWFPELDVAETRRRFRANLEIDDVEPFWEERLYSDAGTEVRFRIGNVELVGTNPCQRCVVPTRSSETGERYADFTSIFEARRYETLPYWATRSRFDHFYRLAVNTRPVAGKGGVIRLGDEVEIIGPK